MWMLYKEIEEEAIMTTEEKYNTQLEQQYQLKQATRRNANTVESNTCRDNVQHLVERAENVGKRITGRIVAMQEQLEIIRRLIKAVTKEVGKKTMKTKVQNEVKETRNKEEQANEKRKKNKQQLEDDGSMDKNKEKLYDDRTAINKKQ